MVIVASSCKSVVPNINELHTALLIVPKKKKKNFTSVPTALVLLQFVLKLDKCSPLLRI